MLTPEDIQSREFLVSLRGYDRDEVHAFLDEVAGDFASLLGGDGGGAGASASAPEVPATPVVEPEPPAPTPEPEPAVVSFAAIGAETQRILEAAQAAADSIRGKAEEEAGNLRQARLAEAESEVEDLRQQAAAISQQIDDLSGRRDELADRLRQARETVDLALLEIAPGTPEAPADPSSSVLAAEGAGEPAAEDSPETASGGAPAKGDPPTPAKAAGRSTGGQKPTAKG